MPITLKHIIFSLLFLSLLGSLQGQDGKLNENSWDEIVNGKKYQEDRENQNEKFKDKENQPEDEESEYDYFDEDRSEPEETEFESHQSSNTVLPTWLSYFLVVIVVGILLFVIVRTTLGNPKLSSQKVKNSLNEKDLVDIEENLFDNELEPLILQAINSQDFKVAVRLQFLYIIRLLTEKGWVNWKKHKTNSQYKIELKGNEFQSNYIYLNRIYESAWFGHDLLNQDSLKKATDIFNRSIGQLKQTKN